MDVPSTGEPLSASVAKNSVLWTLSLQLSHFYEQAGSINTGRIAPEATLTVLLDVPDEGLGQRNETCLRLIPAIKLVGTEKPSIGATIGDPAVNLVVTAVYVQRPL
jgi:hypothetical protein